MPVSHNLANKIKKIGIVFLVIGIILLLAQFYFKGKMEQYDSHYENGYYSSDELFDMVFDLRDRNKYFIFHAGSLALGVLFSVFGGIFLITASKYKPPTYSDDEIYTLLSRNVTGKRPVLCMSKAIYNDVEGLLFFTDVGFEYYPKNFEDETYITIIDQQNVTKIQFPEKTKLVIQTDSKTYCFGIELYELWLNNLSSHYAADKGAGE